MVRELRLVGDRVDHVHLEKPEDQGVEGLLYPGPHPLLHHPLLHIIQGLPLGQAELSVLSDPELLLPRDVGEQPAPLSPPQGELGLSRARRHQPLTVVVSEHLDVILRRRQVHLVGDYQKGLDQREELPGELPRTPCIPSLEIDLVEPRTPQCLGYLMGASLDA